MTLSWKIEETTKVFTDGWRKKQLFTYFRGIKEHTLKFVWGSIILHDYVQSSSLSNCISMYYIVPTKNNNNLILIKFEKMIVLNTD